MRQRLGRYHLLRHLAQGGMGDVWLAELPGAAGFSKRVVLKTLLDSLRAEPRFIKRFVDEGRLLLNLDHPNIAQVLDLDHADEQWFIAMEFVDGFNLRDLLAAQREQPLSEGVTLCVLVALARALEHASTRVNERGVPLGLVHHDVSPSNVMVRRDGLIKLVDFGVARVTRDAVSSEETLRGKLPYMAPEHHHHPDKVDARVDLFALGLIGLELLSGERAMTVSSVEGLEVAWSALASKVAALNCGVATRELIGGLLQRDPDARPKDAAETLRAIRQRLIELEIADYERPVASVFTAAFERLDRAQSSFDQTLSDGLIQLNPNVPGTASLPGISFASKESDATPAPAAPQLDLTPAEVTSRSSPRASRMRWVVVLVLGLGLLFRESLFESSSSPSPEVQVNPAVRGPTPSPVAETSRAPRRPSEIALAVTETAKRALAAKRARAGKGVEAAAPSAAREQSTVKAEVAVAPPPQVPGRRPRPVNTAKSARSGHLVFRVLPANAAVLIDGAPVPKRDGVYRLKLRSGLHQVVVKDPASGRSVRRQERVFAGQERKVPGFVLPGVL